MLRIFAEIDIKNSVKVINLKIKQPIIFEVNISNLLLEMPAEMSS